MLERNSWGLGLGFRVYSGLVGGLGCKVHRDYKEFAKGVLTLYRGHML